ncbi:MAG: phage major capsid protein [Actinophytocola sp.]|uniref:phage major capsid protein n=1 Tax=Actinophytocola sp. TaxID=1872138 RepID=UPI003D6BBB82
MPTYNQLISRDAGTDALVPQPVSAQIIEELPTQSVILQRARKARMSTKTQRMPVLDVLPVSYWVGGDTGLKQTTRQDWKGINLVVEEIATIVPIPEAYLDDAQVPIWNEVRPRMVESAGALLDSATLFGLDKPATWPESIYLHAIAAGNAKVTGTGTDMAQEVAQVGELIAKDGFTVNAFAARPGLRWKLMQMRSAGPEKLPIYQPNLQTGSGGNLLGYDVSEVNNGAWDASDAELIMGDWSKAIVGLRQDISFKMFDQGVISDDAGNVVLNLMQQDAVAMRMVMRVAYALANPASRLNSTAGTGDSNLGARSPFGVLQAATANS